MLIISVACVRLEYRKGEFVGCGKGWVQEINESLMCTKCGRQVMTTGKFRAIDLRS